MATEARAEGKMLADKMGEIYADYGNYLDVLDSFTPASNVLKYILKEGSWIAVRFSGTEPKIKIYYSVKDSDHVAAEKKLTDIWNKIKTKLGLE